MELNFVSKEFADGSAKLICEVPYSRGGTITISTEGPFGVEMLEVYAIRIGLWAEGVVGDVEDIVLLGRQGLIAWYIQNVGYDPDDDAGEAIEIVELAKQVAEMAYLHQFGD